MIIYGKNVRNSGSKVNTSYLDATQYTYICFSFNTVISDVKISFISDAVVI